MCQPKKERVRIPHKVASQRHQTPWMSCMQSPTRWAMGEDVKHVFSIYSASVLHGLLQELWNLRW